MGNARREPLQQHRSIHLVPNQGMNADDSAEAPAEVFHLTLRLPRQSSMIPADSLSADYTSTLTGNRAALPALDPATVLRELFELLEDYSPVWYTEEHHDRAVAALEGTIG
jgi:hypothetical protein